MVGSSGLTACSRTPTVVHSKGFAPISVDRMLDVAAAKFQATQMIHTTKQQWRRWLCRRVFIAAAGILHTIFVKAAGHHLTDIVSVSVRWSKRETAPKMSLTSISLTQLLWRRTMACSALVWLAWKSLCNNKPKSLIISWWLRKAACLRLQL